MKDSIARVESIYTAYAKTNEGKTDKDKGYMTLEKYWKFTLEYLKTCKRSNAGYSDLANFLKGFSYETEQSIQFNLRWLEAKHATSEYNVKRAK